MPSGQPEHHIAFGPVPSRRLGQSLGVNNVTAKSCSYACIYCQVGPTTEMIVEPRTFFSTTQIHEAVTRRVGKLRARGLPIDYLTFVPDGEPTLDSGLGRHIEVLRDLEIPIAVITNGTLLWREEVRARLDHADLVSVKVDTIHEGAWRQLNRPHRALVLATVLQGIEDFAADFAGTLITDTMLIAGINDDATSLGGTADFLARIAPDTAYIAVPTRPTTLDTAHATDEAGLIRAHQIFAGHLRSVELLTGHEVGEFAHTGDARVDLLAVTAVHPMREADVRRLVDADQAGWGLVEGLLAEGALKATEYEGERYFLRPVRHIDG
ncbi:MAG: radical SAM protein [Chromatiaceae bacterium]|nr:radical SAM protein [Chromatiaceae bacterium]